MSREERTGWRDAEFSLRHRQWGMDCPMVDVDFLNFEYYNLEPVAVVDYKRRDDLIMSNSQLFTANHTVLKKVADRYGPGPLPFMIVAYRKHSILGIDHWQLRVYPGNDAALIWYPKTIAQCEFAYVNTLYRMRGIAIPSSIAQILSLQGYQGYENHRRDLDAFRDATGLTVGVPRGTIWTPTFENRHKTPELRDWDLADDVMQSFRAPSIFDDSDG